MMQLLKAKLTTKNICCLYSQNKMWVFQIKERLEDDYFTTDKGIFRFKFEGYYGKNPLWYKVIGALPKNTTKLINCEDKK